MAIELATAYVSIVPEVSQVAPGVRKALGGVDREFEAAGKRSGGLFSKLVGANLVSTGITKAAGAVGASLGSAFSKGFGRLEAIDTAQGKLRGLGHDAASVDKIMESALASVKGTAYGLGDAATLAATAVAAGVKPGQQLTGYLKLAGDAATIAGVSINEMGSIFGKVQTQQRAYTSELNMLADRGIPIYQWLQEELGVSADALRKMVADGQIDSATFYKVIQENIGGAALESGKTFRGALENVGAALGRFGANIMGPVFQQLPSVFAGTISGLDRLAPLATSAGNALGSAFSRAGVFIRGTVTPALQRMWETLQPLGGAFRDIASAVAPLVVDLGRLAIGALVVGWQALQATLSAVVPVIASVAGWIRENDVLVRGLATAVLSGVAAYKAFSIISTIVAFLRSGAVATTAMAVAQRVLNAAMRANPIGLIVTALGALVAGLIYAYKNSETFRNIVNAAWQGVKDVVGAVVGWFVDVVAPFFADLWGRLSAGADGAASGMTSAWQGVQDFFAGMWEGVKSIFSSALDFLVGLFLNFTPLGLLIKHWEPIVGFFTELWGRVSAAFRAGLDAIWAVVGPWIAWFMGVFQAAWGVLEVMIALPIRLAQLAVVAAWQLIQNAFQAAWTWVSGVFMGWWGTLAPLIDAVMGAAFGFIQSRWNNIIANFTAAWTWVSGVFMTWFRTLSALIGTVMDAAQRVIDVAWKWITDRFTQAWQWVSGQFMTWFRTLTSLIDTVMVATRNAISASWQWITDRFTQAWQWVSGTFMGWWRTMTGLMETPIRLAREAIDRILGGIRSGFEQAVNFVRDTWNRIKEIVSAPVRIAIRVGNALISGFRTVARAVGLNDIAGRLVDIPPLPAMASGGRANIVPGSRANGVDSTLAVTSRGVPIARVDPGEGIIRYGAMKSLEQLHPGAFDYINRTGMLPGFFMGGTMPTTPGRASQHSGYSFARWAGDLARPMATPVYAWHDGVVAYVRRLATSYGHHIMLNHAKNLGQSLYAHLSQILVSPGQQVRAGQLIGKVGSTGNSSGPHLHFEIRGGNSPISGSTEGEGAGFFDWAGDLIGKFSGPLRELAGINDSPVGQFIKAVPKMVADGMIQKVKAAAVALFDSVTQSGSVAGGVERWRGVVEQALRIVGQPQSLTDTTLRRMNQESSGNPRAINNWDSNAKRGTPSKGLMQVIDPTFRAYAHPSYNRDIWDPLSNVLASMRYALARYGSLPAAYNRPGGYLTGGLVPRSGPIALSEDGRPELVVGPQYRQARAGTRVYNAADTEAILAGEGRVQLIINNPINSPWPSQAMENSGLVGALAGMG